MLPCLGRTACAIVLATATFAASSVDAPFTAAQRKYWAFQPVARHDPPAIQHAEQAANPVDAFIISRLSAAGLALSPAATKATLIRRVSFDLIGLPPTPAEVDAFVRDGSPLAYEKLIDRLLASPHYGERWARHWLDLARYAESEGFKADETRPNAWRYRDYVIQSFNDNKPYDRFVKEQIAGDELWPDSPQARIATGFNRHYPDESNARNLMQRRQEILNDITDTVGSAFLGMTYGCARCHTHKFDPILHRDYYRLQAFFANTAADDQISMISAVELQSFRERKAVWEEKTKSIRDQMAALLKPIKASIVKEYVDKYPPEIQAVISKPAAERTPYEWQMFYKAKPYLEIDDDTASKSLKGEARKKYAELTMALKPFSSLDPGEAPIGIGMHDVSKQAPETRILYGGNYDAPQEVVEPGFLSILEAAPAKIAPPNGLDTTGRRTALANWLASADNPLTARVMVNRIWHYHFGQGLAPEPSDFGLMGGKPTHPELLDWLTSEFTRTGWDVKRMHKLILMSNTYQQSTAGNAAAAKADPRNKLLWQFRRERLEGEVIRDAALAVAGLLDEKLGGPSVFPPLPDGAGKPRGGWKTPADASETNRRSIYIFIRRNARFPMMEAFDMPDTHESCGRRNQTITAPQAMALLNDKNSLLWAQAFAGRVIGLGGADEKADIEAAYRLAYGRSPDGFEKDTVSTFLARQKQITAERAASGEKLALPASFPDAFDKPTAAALVDLCQMLLNSNEFVYRN